MTNWKILFAGVLVMASAGCGDDAACVDGACTGTGGASTGTGGATQGSGGATSAGGNGGGGTCQATPENCVTPADEDCDGETPACTGTEEWVTFLQGTGEFTALRAQPDGSVLALFQHSAGLVVAGDTLGSFGSVVLSLTPQGDVAWYFDCPSCGANDLARLPDGRVVFGGQLYGDATATLGIAGPGGFVIVLSATGQKLAGVGYSASAQVSVDAIEATASGFVMAGRNGSANGLTIGSTSLAAHTDFLAELDPTLTSGWVTTYGDAQNSATIYDLDVRGSDGAIAMVGEIETAGTGVDFGGGPIMVAAVATFDATGAYQAQTELDSTPYAAVWTGPDLLVLGQAVAPPGSAAGLGLYSFDASLTLGAQSIYALQNQLQWQKQRQPLALDPFGNVIYGGNPTKLADGSPFSGRAVFVGKLAPDLAYVWQRAFMGDQMQSPDTYVVDAAASSIFIAGNAASGTVFDTATSGNAAPFIARLAP